MKFSEFRKLKGPVILRTSAPEDKSRTYYIHYRYLTDIKPDEGYKSITARERMWMGIDIRDTQNSFTIKLVDETYTLNPNLSIDRRGVTEADVMSPQVGKQSMIKDILS